MMLANKGKFSVSSHHHKGRGVLEIFWSQKNAVAIKNNKLDCILHKEISIWNNMYEDAVHKLLQHINRSKKYMFISVEPGLKRQF